MERMLFWKRMLIIVFIVGYVLVVFFNLVSSDSVGEKATRIIIFTIVMPLMFLILYKVGSAVIKRT
ncbi:hypothetical protein [Priestia koreensis]|uniref:hypothetical protein n=1 Tax=Priestia koreensis TaxID=284581 RepID=UPI001F5AB704|nr:hypothetical protein [Priestia koreensis]MCM3007049.1 hypothetical protein [Priestia koreensis]UNL85477.1 hypothetical protein IE339_02845 [Priestia koreensis]